MSRCQIRPKGGILLEDIHFGYRRRRGRFHPELERAIPYYDDHEAVRIPSDQHPEKWI